MQLADIRNKPLCYTALFASALATAMTRVIVFWDSQSVRLSVCPYVQLGLGNID